ncbi:hypothetical protein H072_6868 [Dactylellina haptotyla CBS 200.50]|uniref:Uncharacterized protein n=1 Tax=Dactylellina haptotyla (strain CBS 200.50) TaxID=1284197 RepID=S8A960_DACHA|nr:hypothetical protein H072_6868 [Dactylellina haptotyla CBS 200.50]
MMLSARDQENRVQLGGVQTGKNQFPKTPGQGPAKTPFGGKRNDENGVSAMPIAGKTAFKAHADALQTPLGPRSRVPLGGKDTNVKAKHTIQFNDPLQQTGKPNKAPPSSTKQTTRLRRQTRLSVTPAKPITQDEDDVPEIEYIPPPPKELPDVPEDYVRINVGVIKQNLFRDANSTPLYDAKRREQFQKLTEHDEAKEEEELRLKVEAMLLEMERGTEKGKQAWKELDSMDFDGDVTVREKKRVPATTRAYETATKSSLAKRGPSRPASALSNRSGNSGTVRKPSSSALHTRKPSVPTNKMVQQPRENPRTGLVPSITKHGDYHNAVGRKLGPIYRDEILEAKRKVDSGECGINDIDYDELEERALRESEKRVTPKEDIEQKMRDLFRMDDEDDEVYQIPLDF